jgi:hypothetical protein
MTNEQLQTGRIITSSISCLKDEIENLQTAISTGYCWINTDMDKPFMVRIFEKDIESVCNIILKSKKEELNRLQQEFEQL